MTLIQQSLPPPDPLWGGMGAVERQMSIKDWQLRNLPSVSAILAEDALPQSFLTVEMDKIPYIYNQGQVPRCVASSFTGAKSIEDFLDVNVWNVYDDVELYLASGGNGSTGISTDTSLHYAVTTGVRNVETSFRWRISGYAFAPNIPGEWRKTLAAALISSGPCVVATLLPSVFGWDSNDEPTSGYHQMCLIGYSGLGDNDYAIFLNSWGREWGNMGFGRLKWGYLEGRDFLYNYVYGYKLIDEIDMPAPIPKPPPPPPTPVGATPLITTVFPKKVGSKKIVVKGDNFDPASVLFINGSRSTAVMENDRFVVKLHGEGTVELIVENEGGKHSPPYHYINV